MEELKNMILRMKTSLQQLYIFCVNIFDLFNEQIYIQLYFKRKR